MKRLGSVATSSLALFGLTLALLGCDTSNPVAPSPVPDPGAGGVAYVVTVTASPTQLLAGGSDAATLSVNVIRQDNQLAPPDGTPVSLSVDQGSLNVNDANNPVRVLTTQLTSGRVQVSYFAGATVATVNVLAQVGQNTGRTSLQLVDALPNNFFITSVTPGVGKAEGGDRVTIAGAGFKEPLRVTFGSVAARVLSVSGSSRIVVESPPAAQAPAPGTSVPVNVTVTNSLTDPTPATDTLPGGFFYTEDPTPTPNPVFITSVQPASGAATGSTTVVVVGGGFRAPLTVEFGGNAGQVVSATNTRITVITPAAPQPVAAGSNLPVAVQVTSGLDQATPQSASLAGGFTYQGGPAPVAVVVSSISPASGPYTGGTVVTITGSGFNGAVAVTLGGVRQTAETVVSPTEVRFTTAALSLAQCPPSGVQTVTGVTVTNQFSGTSGTAALSFGYQVPLPRITRISPTVGSQLGNTVISIEGTGFENAVRVNFNEGSQSFAAVVQGTPTATLVRAASPRVPDSLFPETDCVTNDDQAGKRWLPIAVDVAVINQQSGCSDTFANSFTYQPTLASCRVVAPPP